MQTYLMDLGFNIWQLIVLGYVAQTTPPTYVDGKKLSENNAKSMNVILCDLSKSKFVKVMHCESTKEIWDEL